MSAPRGFRDRARDHLLAEEGRLLNLLDANIGDDRTAQCAITVLALRSMVEARTA
jgi:hypothetical protein